MSSVAKKKKRSESVNCVCIERTDKKKESKMNICFRGNPKALGLYTAALANGLKLHRVDVTHLKKQ